MNAMRSSALVLTLSFLAAVSSASRAQEGSANAERAPAPEAAPASADDTAPIRLDYMETVEVDLLQVNVIVTDPDGNPVLDLTKDDFEVKVNRKTAKVAYVDRNASAGAPTPISAREATRLDEERAVRPDAPASAGKAAEARRWIVLLFDRATTSMRTRKAAVTAAGQWLATERRPGDRVSIVVYDGKLNVVCSFTTDLTLLQTAMRDVERAEGITPPDRPSALAFLASQLEQCKAYPDPGTCAYGYLRPYENDLVRERRAVMSALTLLTRSMASIPDIKSVLFFSDGFARNPSEDGLNVVQAIFGFQVRSRMVPTYRSDQEQDYRMLAEAASLSRTTVFTIFPGGANEMGMTSAAQRSPVSETVGTEVIDYFDRSAKNFEFGLADASLRTGGIPTTRGDALAALTQSLDRAEGLYTIGIYTAGLGQYREYDIKFKPRRKGLRFAEDREVPRLRRANPLGGSLSLRPEACSADGRRALSLELKVDPQTLTFTKAEKVRAANFAVFTMIFDPARQETLHEDYRFLTSTSSDLDRDPTKQIVPTIEQRLAVPCRPLSVIVTVTDAESGARGRFVQELD